MSPARRRTADMIGPRGCVDCLAWGRLGGRRCVACAVFRHDNPGRDRCAGCGRVLAIKHGYCRLCWHQAGLDGNAAGRRRGADAAYLHGRLDLAPIRYHQLFFDRMKYRRATGPVYVHDRRGRPRKTAPPPAGPPQVGWIQPPLFTAGRDYTRIIDSTAYPDGPPGPWLAWARHLAHHRGEARGWHPALLTAVDRILTILLSGHIPGDTITVTQVHTLCTRLDAGAERVCEVLAEMNILDDDRRPAFDGWLHRKLTGLAPGIRNAVEAWLRTLHDGGPRSRARHPSTARNYLNKALPSLLTWSNRYDHLREVTRDDIIAELDARHGSQRENLLIALRSLFRHCSKTRTIFRNPAARIKVGQHAYGILQPLHPDDVDQAVTAATRPGHHHARNPKPHSKQRHTSIKDRNVQDHERSGLVARFGGIPLRRKKNAVLTDRYPLPVTVRRKELITRLVAGKCEMCGQTGTVDVHHVRRLADLDRPGRPQPAWTQLMAKRRRKTLVVCPSCHDTIHARQPTTTTTQ